MKTRVEIETEARALDQVGAEALAVRSEQLGPMVANGEAIEIHRFPESTVTLGPGRGIEVAETHRMLRHIAVALVAERPEYRLVEEEFVTNADGRAVRHFEPINLVTSDSALDVLVAGYQRQDEDRMRERLAQLEHRLETVAIEGAVTPDAIAEVAATTDSLALSPGARMRMRADAIALLEGRLEAGDFVARSVARQQCYEAVGDEVIAQQITERIDVA